jgi:putative transposase
MSRLRRIADCDRFFFFVTTNLSRSVPFFRPHEMDMALEVLNQVRRQMGFHLLGYVVMPDHCHALLETHLQSLSHIMHQWKFKTGFVIQKHRQMHGTLWQPRYFDFICRRSRDVSDKLFYIHENPVTRNLVKQPEDWKWSSAGFYLKRENPPIVPDLVELAGDPGELLWPAPNRL